MGFFVAALCILSQRQSSEMMGKKKGVYTDCSAGGSQSSDGKWGDVGTRCQQWDSCYFSSVLL
jgi:hypothetical protein